MEIKCFSKLEILTLAAQDFSNWVQTDVIVYKTLINGCPDYVNEYLVPYTCSMNTRHRNPNHKIFHTVTYNGGLHSSFTQLNCSFAPSAPDCGIIYPWKSAFSDTLTAGGPLYITPQKFPENAISRKIPLNLDIQHTCLRPKAYKVLTTAYVHVYCTAQCAQTQT